MSSKSSRSPIFILISILILGFVAWFLFSKESMTKKTGEKLSPTNANLISSSNLNLGATPTNWQPAKTSASKAQKSIRNSPLRNDYYALYFNQYLMRKPEVSSLYQYMKDILPRSPVTDLMAMYIAEGAAPDGSIEFNYFLDSLEEKMSYHTHEIYNEVLASEEMLKADPFAYQMVLNMTHSMNLDPDQKARIYGRAIVSAMEVKDGDISADASNITISFIQMRNSGITAEMARPYIEEGIRLNQNNPEALEEYLARAKTYYPELFESQE